MSGRRHSLALAALLSLAGCETPVSSIGAVTRIPPDKVVAERHGSDEAASSHTICLANGMSESLFSAHGDQAKVTIARADWLGATARVEATDGSDGTVTSADVTLAPAGPPRIANLFRHGQWVQPAQAYDYAFMGVLAQQALQQRQLTCPVYQPQEAAEDNTRF